MKKIFKSILIILLILMVSALVVGVGGCLAFGENKSTDNNNKPAEIQSVSIVTKGDEVIAYLQVKIYGTYSQKVDIKNIDVSISGNNVNVNVPVIQTNAVNTREIGFETITVVLGKKDQFKDGDYKLIVNGNTEKESVTDFKIVDGTFYFTKDALVNTAIVEADGNKIMLNTTVTLGGSAETVDTENISVTGSFEQNDLAVKIPTQMRDGITTLNIAWENVVVEIGQLDELEDGIYTVTVNGEEVSFTVENHKLITE